ncbi:MAG: 50S ribosomal protein L21 [bacterium]|nr:50S ribosomal protein L21 [bacterium]
MIEEFAIIKTGGKQYLVTKGQKLQVEKLPEKEGEDVSFSSVLLHQKGEAIAVGKPTLEKVLVKGKVLREIKGKKVIAYNFKAKKREKTKQGHRQQYSEVEITEIAG